MAVLFAVLGAVVAAETRVGTGTTPAASPWAKGRFQLRRTVVDGWTLVQPEGDEVFVLAVNHLAPPYFFDVIQGESRLAAFVWLISCLRAPSSKK